MMISRRKIIFAGIALLWLTIVCIDGYINILHGVSLPGYGYETQWQFQLLVFLTSRFIIYLFALFIVIVSIWFYYRRR